MESLPKTRNLQFGKVFTPLISVEDGDGWLLGLLLALPHLKILKKSGEKATKLQTKRFKTFETQSMGFPLGLGEGWNQSEVRGLGDLERWWCCCSAVHVRRIHVQGNRRSTENPCRKPRRFHLFPIFLEPASFLGCLSFKSQQSMVTFSRGIGP